MVGAFIDKGISDWQIFQQINGVANISIEGHFRIEKQYGDVVSIYVSVLLENDNSFVVYMQRAQILPGNKWSIVLENVPAGGLYKIETCAATSLSSRNIRGDMRHHVGVGDIFVIAGQSEVSGWEQSFINDPTELGVHVYRRNGKWDLAAHPLNDFTDAPDNKYCEDINEGHSPWLSFAKTIKRKTGYPIGLLPAAYKGSSITDWDTEKSGQCYSLMIKEIYKLGGVVSGIIWFLGASETCSLKRAQGYGAAFSKIVAKSRIELQNPNLPWYMLQLNRSLKVCGNSPDTDVKWGVVREQQRRVSSEMNNVYLIPSIDCANLKPSVNVMLGERVANMVMATLYKDETYKFAPNIISATYNEENLEIVLKFANVNECLIARGEFDMPFSVKDEEDFCTVKSYKDIKDTVVLYLEKPLKGKAVVSGYWQACPSYFTIVDATTRLPVIPFYEVEIDCDGKTV